MISFKDGVKVDHVHKEVFHMILVAHDVYKEQGRDLVVTSISDGRHMTTSLHYKGKAIDIRIWGINTAKAVDGLKKSLGKDYDVVFEGDHIHIEYDPN